MSSLRREVAPLRTPDRFGDRESHGPRLPRVRPARADAELGRALEKGDGQPAGRVDRELGLRGARHRAGPRDVHRGSHPGGVRSAKVYDL